MNRRICFVGRIVVGADTIDVQRNRDIWVDEGCAEVAMALNGYDLQGSDTRFLHLLGVEMAT